MEKFAGYGFNKSHAAAYALLAYHTAWLKAHYPSEFTAANMSVAIDDTDKLKIFHDDAVTLGLTFEHPNINTGTYRFEPVGDHKGASSSGGERGRVRYGLGAIKGTGQGAIESIVEVRSQGGPFRSFFDFCARIDRSRVNKRVVEALVKGGAFDALQPDRAALLASISLGFDYADNQAAHADQGGLFDFGDSGGHGSSTQEPELVPVAPWSIKERLTHEKTAIGFYLSGHLFDECAAEVRQFAKRRIADLIDSREPQLLAGIVSDLRFVNGQRGRVAIFKLDDKSEVIEAVANEELINANKELWKDDELLVVQGKVQPDRFSGGLRLNVQQAWDLGTSRCRFGRYLRVAVNGKAPPVAELLREFPPRRQNTEQGDLVQGLPVRLLLERKNPVLAAQGELDLGEDSRFFPSDAALARWRDGSHGQSAVVVYE
jgi:DNA polymerase-3 subunit alpha